MDAQSGKKLGSHVLPMGKSSQSTVDHDSGSDRITARVGSRTKKAKVVFDPSDHHVPRKRNRRGENEGTGAAKPESNRTATPSSSSSNDSISNNNYVQSSTTTPTTAIAAAPAPSASALLRQRGTTPTTALRCCQKCGRSGPGRMPRKTPIAPWTCVSCLAGKTESNSRPPSNRQGQSCNRRQSGSDRTAEDDDEDDNSDHDGDGEDDEEEDGSKQQHDFAGFSETELSGHGKEKESAASDRLNSPVKIEHDANSNDGHNGVRKHTATKRIKSEQSDGESDDASAKEIRYWSCDDVCRYFGRHCKAWGKLFHEQEIDGPSLLLMRRGDVLTRFGLKLGPAMELYQRIVALQNGDRDVVDVRLTWI
uniref:SAM domain-containing protein n=1 Tax=Anopheles farauti TaxID=69004 RepID=A0A182Q040_9DIPT